MADFDVDEFLEGLEPRVSEARVLIPNSALAQRHAELEAELRQAVADDERLNREPLAPQIAEQIERLEAEMAESASKVFRFRGIGARAWSDLLAKHPPTKEQREANPLADHNPLTMPVVAVAASSLDPKLTLDQARKLEERLDLTEWTKLWMAVLDANVGGDAHPKSMLAGMIRRQSEPSETTPVSEESPEASSWGE